MERLHTSGREIKKKDGNGYETTTLYDRRGYIVATNIDEAHLNLCKEVTYDGLGNTLYQYTSVNNHPDVYVTHTLRDGLGRSTATIRDPDGLHIGILSAYDEKNNVISVTDGNGNTTYSTFDAHDREVYRTDPDGNVMGCSYNASSLLIEKRQYSTNAGVGARVSSDYPKNIDDQVDYYLYDQDRRMIASLNANGLYTAFLYNGAGQKIYERQYATPYQDVTLITPPIADDANDRQFAWGYDAMQRERFYIDPEGLIKETRYDLLGRKIAVIFYAEPASSYTTPPSFEKLTLHPDNRITTIIYDGLSRVQFHINPEGYVTEYSYDQGDKPTITWFYPDALSFTDGLRINISREMLIHVLPSHDTVVSPQ